MDSSWRKLVAPAMKVTALVETVERLVEERQARTAQTGSQMQRCCCMKSWCSHGTLVHSSAAEDSFFQCSFLEPLKVAGADRLDQVLEWEVQVRRELYAAECYL